MFIASSAPLMAPMTGSIGEWLLCSTDEEHTRVAGITRARSREAAVRGANAMRDRKFSRRDVLNASMGMAFGAVFPEPLKGAAPERAPSLARSQFRASAVGVLTSPFAGTGRRSLNTLGTSNRCFI